MWQNLDQLLQGYELWQVAIELIVIWVCVYIVFSFLQGTRGAGVIKGFAVLIVAVTLALRVLGQGSDAFARLNFIYDRFLGLLAVVLIVVFQPELRQAMIRLGHAWSFRASRTTAEKVIDAVADAVSFLSKSQFGALIAIERQSQLGGLTETGTMLDAEITAPLLESIFWPNSPLHDLGVVVRGDRIVAASVQFPLAEEGVLSTEFGSRHRAAVGLTLESDCVVVIVSEESGAVSIAERGVLEHGIPRDEFRNVLAQRLAAAPAPTPPPDAPTTAEATEHGEGQQGKKEDKQQAA